MTSQRKLKGRVRARMAKTGESYVTARRALTSSPERPVTLAGGYALRGGMHPDTSAVANLLANTGTAGDDGSALSEAAVLGVGGGLGAGYILWEFAAHDTRAVVLGFRNQWQYPGRWMPKVLERLGLEHTLAETGGARRAAATLDEALDAGEPAIAWVDPVPLGYRHSPAWRRGRDGWPVVIAGRDGEERVAIDDRNLAPISVDHDQLAAGRASVPSFKHRLIRVDAGQALPAARLVEGFQAGLREQVEHLASPSDSFGLPAWRKWGRLMTDRRNAKAWPRVFADQRGLFGALVSVRAGLEPIGADGGSLRGLYADFLDEAAARLERPALEDAAAAYRELAVAWHELAEAAIPAELERATGVGRALVDLHDAVHEGGDGERAEAQDAAARLWGAQAEHADALPLDDDAVEALLAGMGARLLALFEAEQVALDRLAAAL